MAVGSVSSGNSGYVTPKEQSESVSVTENNRPARDGSNFCKIAGVALLCLGLLAVGIALITCGAIFANPALICAGVGLFVGMIGAVARGVFAPNC
jgi:hypothetical protein